MARTTDTPPAASLGQVVLVLGAVAEHNGAKVAPGIVTRVDGDKVNVTVLPDGYAPRHATDVRVHPDEQAARTALKGDATTVAYRA